MNAMSEEYGGARFYKVIGDSSADASSLMKREGVRAVPSFHFWKNGEKVERFSGVFLNIYLVRPCRACTVSTQVDVVNGANIDAVTANVVKYL